ncbi:hypothetical protein MLD38_008330 [Melastoma candidum]|uniref:Uncharacterized protein n=1 Tax=Melastoma candidum TaxID=119954 RepID=A0ACB9S2H9_9MYRT|nr:hypothetical protein MLD38_008330 [Melastoma candidum]
MDEELLELQRQFEFAQAAKSSIRLSERNVVELVQKLQELAIIDFDLLHTVSGKEYITPVVHSSSFRSFYSIVLVHFIFCVILVVVLESQSFRIS